MQSSKCNCRDTTTYHLTSSWLPQSPNFRKNEKAILLFPGSPLNSPVYGPICTPHPNCSCPFLRLISPPVLETLSVFIPHHLTPSSSYGFWNQPWPLSHLFPLLISFIFQEKLSLELTPLSSYRPVSVCPLKPNSLIEMSALPSLPPHW